MRLNIVVEYLILIYFFSIILHNKLVVKILLFSIIPFLLYIILDYFNDAKNSLPNNPSVVEFLVFIVILIYFFFEKMTQSALVPIYQTINFWICVGLFLYFTGSFFFLLLLANVDKSDIKLKSEMKIIYSVVTITKNIILGLALLTREEKEEEIKEFHMPDELYFDNFPPTKSSN